MSGSRRHLLPAPAGGRGCHGYGRGGLRNGGGAGGGGGGAGPGRGLPGLRADGGAAGQAEAAGLRGGGGAAAAQHAPALQVAARPGDVGAGGEELGLRWQRLSVGSGWVRGEV